MNGLTLRLRSKRRRPLSALFPKNGMHLHVTEKMLYLRLCVSGPWAYLEFRPYPVFHDTFFPPLSDIASLLADMSLQDLGLEVVGLVCSTIAARNNRPSLFRLQGEVRLIGRESS